MFESAPCLGRRRPNPSSKGTQDKPSVGVQNKPCATQAFEGPARRPLLLFCCCLCPRAPSIVSTCRRGVKGGMRAGRCGARNSPRGEGGGRQLPLQRSIGRLDEGTDDEGTNEGNLTIPKWARSSAGERPPHTREVTGSIPVAPTIPSRLRPEDPPTGRTHHPTAPTISLRAPPCRVCDSAEPIKSRAAERAGSPADRRTDRARVKQDVCAEPTRTTRARPSVGRRPGTMDTSRHNGQ